MLLVPSLKPIRLRGVVWPAPVADARPKPSWDHLSTAVPRAALTMLRIAWNTTCGSSAQAWMHRSPSEIAGFITASPGMVPNGVSSAGILAASPNRSSNRLGPKPTVMVSECGPRSIDSPVSNGGCSSRTGESLTSLPAVSRAAIAAQRPSIRLSSSTSVVVTSRAANISRSC